ncbi:hypothetical protein [Usitatibacter palustris]|uniref:Uncharacterized protein n=1 Tax=Usitatibacter palustris TaxID=2732487 RepID=A0A6M4H6E5_9PROT|nr:hypothetical protein [Usitatibacter palustris]QJR14518.1 hypothetical protein DSM104440_01319 [Usitatibacter palustris]
MSAANQHQNTGTFMLSKELEILMAERTKLLKVAGAAAQFVALMESRKLPESVATEADILAQSVNDLPEDTLRDALGVITRT